MGFAGTHAAHGLRSMLRTAGRERLGLDTDVLEAQLAHAKRGNVHKAYDRTTFGDARRDRMQRWADYLDRIFATSGLDRGTGDAGQLPLARRRSTRARRSRFQREVRRGTTGRALCPDGEPKRPPSRRRSSL